MFGYHFPPIELLLDGNEQDQQHKSEYAQYLENTLRQTLKDFKVNADIKRVECNPFAVLITIQLNPGETVRKIYNLRNDIELALASPIEITTTVELPRGVIIAVKSLDRPIVSLKSIINSDEFKSSKSPLTVGVGCDLFGDKFILDLVETPNVIVAGTTGSGKSTFISDLILSIMYKATPDDVRMILVDPKMVDLTPYNGIPFLLSPVVTRTEQALQAMRWAREEMDSRIIKFNALDVDDIEEYNRTQSDKMYRIVIVVDEYMEMIFHAPKELEDIIRVLSSRSKKAGIHLVLSTQRPYKDVITPSIKSNIPCRASFTVVDKRESQIAINMTGAERLLGHGDMIFTRRDDDNPIHAQAAYVSYNEIDKVIDYIKKGYDQSRKYEIQE